MFITGIIAAAAAAKWLVAAKIVTTIGTVFIASQPVADAIKDNQQRLNARNAYQKDEEEEEA